MPNRLYRTDLVFELEVLTSLRVGSGETDASFAEDEVQGTNQRPENILLLERDVRGLPVIPGSSIKGCFRAVVGGESRGLFGAPGDYGTEDDLQEERVPDPGLQGAVIFGDACCFVEENAAPPHVENVARTKIDHGRGAAAKNALFTSEVVQPGAVFKLPIRVQARHELGSLIDQFLECLEQLSSERGFQIGGGKSAGQGVLRVSPNYTRIDWFALDGAFKPGNSKSERLKVSEAQAVFRSYRFFCEGPYITKAPDPDADVIGPNVSAARVGDIPRITGTMIKGALRQKTSWHEATGAMPKGAADRLFGTLDAAGVVRLMVSKIETSGKVELTSNKIDRFSAGTVDNALMTVDADVGVSFTLKALFGHRSEDGDQDLFESIFDDPTGAGLKLGFGVSKGFGWFRRVPG